LGSDENETFRTVFFGKHTLVCANVLTVQALWLLGQCGDRWCKFRWAEGGTPGYFRVNCCEFARVCVRPHREGYV